MELCAGKRLTQKDKAKEKSIRDKEQQLERTRAEAAALHEQLLAENTQLKQEKQSLLEQVTPRRDPTPLGPQPWVTPR